MPPFEEIYERIQVATNCRTQVELAQVLDIRQSSISDAKRRNSVPGDWYMKLFEKFGLNPDWLKQGVGPRYLRTDRGYGPVEAPVGLEEPAALYGDAMAGGGIVSFYDPACQYSDDAPRPPLQVSGKIFLPRALTDSGMLVLRVQGRNMAPLIGEGAYAGIRTLDTAIVSGHVYALFAPYEGVILRRVFLNGGQDGYALRSDAPEFPETFLSVTMLDRRLLGRVAWVLQTL